MKKVIGVYHKSVVLTYIGIVISAWGMLHAKDLNVAMICLAIAGICDLFDGKIARMCKRTEQEKQFGIQIDSLADVVSFLVFPLILLNQNGTVVTFIISMIYVLAGVTRLAWFNITVQEKLTHYQGVPVTYAALVLPVVYVLCSYIPILDYQGIACIVYVVLAFCFVWNVPVKKPTGIWYVVFAMIAILVITLLGLRV